ncbi:class I SAM-dependent methyltransferase [Mixta tenebrionis]|uniref:Class I SAM-dependent methyltransferase n=1 Tax=Mixta tenebrionis TaxID=2562439 RepID=A0A506VDC0_9GAMM|nr:MULTISPECIES: class I SAM-dependent methyltransferase [Mixta]QHM76843.1 27-O-demethylrifamycin SV methyltransferase [Mixta theicola]TPW43747.1 class I SAM-dependent methyltransferase [Mixta tenebrionis]
MSDSKKAGHTFLASLGKTRLRPGGAEATEWLLAQAGLNPQSKVLEIACNMGTTSIELVSRFGCQVYAVDMDKQALGKAQENVAAAGLSDRIHISEANAHHLPFPDNSFDVVINEAMLTMYADKAKRRLVQEYYRVLKPGGCLLTHDIMLTQGQLEVNADARLQQIVKSNVSPMSQENWQALFYQVGFTQVQTHNGPMSLMSPRGMIKDEGVARALRIAFNGLKNRENRQRFLGMFRYFRAQRRYMNYIACCSRKA